MLDYREKAVNQRDPDALNMELDNMMCKKENKHTIRKMLLSDYEDTAEYVYRDDDWIPGYKSYSCRIWAVIKS